MSKSDQNRTGKAPKHTDLEGKQKERTADGLSETDLSRLKHFYKTGNEFPSMQELELKPMHPTAKKAIRKWRSKHQILVDGREPSDQFLFSYMQLLVPKFFTDYNHLASAPEQTLRKVANAISNVISVSAIRNLSSLLAPSESLVKLNQQIEENPSDISLLRTQAAELFELKNYAEAKKVLKQILEIDSSLSTEIHRELRVLDAFLRPKIVQNVPTPAERKLKKQNAQIRTVTQAPEALQEKEKKSQALATLKVEYKEAGSNPSDKWRYHLERALAFIVLVKRKDALDEINQAIKLKPDEAYLYKIRGVIFHGLGKTTESQKDNEYAAWLSAPLDGNNQYHLNFTVLPEGFWRSESAINSLLSTYPNLNRQAVGNAVERMKNMDNLGHIQSWVGGPRRSSDVYFVYEFEDCVVAECPAYGNAIYALRPKDNWRQMFSLTKAQLQRRGATVIHHRGDWQIRLRDFIRNRYHRYRY